MEAPANHITPTAFANTIEEKLAPHAERVTVNKRFGPYLFCLFTLGLYTHNFNCHSPKPVCKHFLKWT